MVGMMREAWEGFRLSRQQVRLWNLRATRSTDVALAGVSIHGSLDADALAAAVADLTEAQEILRISIRPALGDASAPLMAIAPPGSIPFARIDLAGLDPDVQDREIAALPRSQQGMPSDAAISHPVRWTLFRKSPTRHVLVVIASCYLLDTASAFHLIEALADAYAARVEGTPCPQADIVQYPDFAQWQFDAGQGADGSELFAAWHQTGSTVPPLRLPLEFPTRAPPLDRVSWTLSPQTVMALTALAARQGTELSVVVQACWHAALWRVGGEPDRTMVHTGFPCRPFNELARAVGRFERHMPVVQDITPATSFNALIRSLAQTHDRALAGEIGLARLSEEHDGQALPHVGFSWTERPGDVAAASLLWNEVWADVPGEPFKLALYGEVAGKAVDLSLRFETSGIDQTGVAAVAEALRAMIDAAAATPGARVAEQPLLAPARAAAQVSQRNPRSTALGSPTCWHAAFGAHARRFPDESALSCADRHWTYGELDVLANRMARLLQRRGVARGDRVAMMVERSDMAIVSMIAIAKAGAAYAPIEPSLPPHRREVILAQLAPRLIVTDAASRPAGAAGTARSLCVEGDRSAIDAEDAAPLEVEAGEQDLAYVIFTSGSTGLPKGVAVEHGQVMHYMDGILDRLRIGSGARCVAPTTLATDLGNTAIFAALCTGGSLDIIPLAIASDAQALAAHLADRTYDLMKITPSHLAALVAIAEAPARLMPRQALVLGGEALSWGMFRLFRSFADCPIYNHYGPTESCVGAVSGEIAEDGPSTLAATVPLGHPLKHARAYVVDRHGHPVPPGVPGELWIGGRTVARGYLDVADEVADRFCTDAWAGHAGGRAYRTGDRVRQLPDGKIEFLGRIDRQLKIRGFRVEPGEIEFVLCQHPDVTASLVVEAGESGNTRLVAYVVGQGGGVGMADWLRPFLCERLPEFMVPAEIVSLSRFPLTGTGKIDMGRLPDPAAVRAAAKTGAEEPRTETERIVAGIFAELLLLERVGVGDDFFDIGGHSLLATRLLARLRSAFAIDIRLRSIFEDASVAGLAARIDASLAPQVAA